MKHIRVFAILLLLITVVLPVNASITSDILIEDNAGMLTNNEEQLIENILFNLEQQTEIEYAVVTIKSLEGRTIEEYAVNLFRNKGIGKKDKNNGLLLLIALQEREFRLEVGYGLEGIIPDITAKKIIDTMIPDFKGEKYYDGIEKAVLTTVSYIGQSGEYNIEGDLAKRSEEATKNKKSNLTFILYFIIMIIIIIFNNRNRGNRRRRFFYFGSGGFGRGGGSSFGGGSFGGGSSGGGGASGGW